MFKKIAVKVIYYLILAQKKIELFPERLLETLWERSGYAVGTVPGNVPRNVPSNVSRSVSRSDSRKRCGSITGTVAKKRFQ